MRDQPKEVFHRRHGSFGFLAPLSQKLGGVL
jgi:hypothetical protein